MSYRMLNNLNIRNNNNTGCRAPDNSPVPVTSRLVRVAFSAQKPPRPRATDPRRRQTHAALMGQQERVRTSRPKTTHPKKRRSLVNGEAINQSPKRRGGRPRQLTTSEAARARGSYSIFFEKNAKQCDTEGPVYELTEDKCTDVPIHTYARRMPP